MNKKTDKTKSSLNTKNSIIEAAIEVFVEKGFLKATLEEIAAKAGVTRGAVYWHFKNKHEIFSELHEMLSQPLNASILEDMKQNQDDSLQQLKELCIKLLIDLDNDSVRKKILTIFLCKCDYSCGMEDILEQQRQKKMNNIELLSNYFDRAKKSGCLSCEDDSKILAISLTCYMCGLVSEYLRNPELFNLKQQAPLLIKQFFASFKP